LIKTKAINETLNLLFIKKNIMKKNIYIIAIFISILLNACQADEIEKILNSEDIEQTTRSLRPDGFENDWENRTHINLTDGRRVELPWVSSAVTDAPLEVCQDIKKENGWNFVSTTNDDLGSDYLIFYNKYTGILKAFYYHKETALNNNAIWTFYDQQKKGYLNQGTFFTTPMNKEAAGNVSASALSRSSTLGIGKGWNCFQIPITYAGGKTANIDVSPMVLNISSLEFKGNYKEKTEGTIIEKHSTNPASSVFSTIAKATGKGVDKWITQTANESKNDSVTNAPSQKGIFKNISQSVLTDLASGGSTYLVNSGLNALFGSFIGIFKKNTPKIQTVELTTTGELVGSGTIQFPSTSIAPSLNGIDVTKFGSWNLSEAPKLTPNIKLIKVVPYSPINGTPISEYFEVNFRPSFNVIINPEIKDEVEVQTSYGFKILQGPKWDTFFKQYYNLVKNNNIRVLTNSDPGMESSFITLNQDDPNANENNRVILASPDVVVSTKKYNIDPAYFRNPNEFHKALYPYVYSYPYTHSKKESYPSYYSRAELSNGTINQQPVLYPGNVAITITVTMTVKQTKEKIISSRTYLPEYNFNYWN